MRTLPFWQQDITDKLIAGIVTPEDVIADFIKATPEERKVIEFNLNATGRLPNYHKFLGPYKLEDIPFELHMNFFNTVDLAHRLQDDYGYELLSTNLFRSKAHHIRIYRNKGIKDVNIPMLSKHLFAQATDLVPLKKPVAHFQSWLDEKKREEHNTWTERYKYTKSWVHAQIVPYGSWSFGKRRDYVP